MNQREAKLENQRAQINREELVERMARALPEDGFLEGFPGFYLARLSRTSEPVLVVHEPAFCLVAQGGKRVLLGEEVFRYDPGHYLIFTVDLPVVFQVEEASEELPYLGLRLDLDPSLVASVMMEAGFETKRSDASVKALDASPVDAELLDAVVRLVRLLDKPGEQKILASHITREIIYRLLMGRQGARLSHLLDSSGGDTRRISKRSGGCADITTSSSRSKTSHVS